VESKSNGPPSGSTLTAAPPAALPSVHVTPRKRATTQSPAAKPSTLRRRARGGGPSSLSRVSHRSLVGEGDATPRSPFSSDGAEAEARSESDEIEEDASLRALVPAPKRHPVWSFHPSQKEWVGGVDDSPPPDADNQEIAERIDQADEERERVDQSSVDAEARAMLGAELEYEQDWTSFTPDSSGTWNLPTSPHEAASKVTRAETCKATPPSRNRNTRPVRCPSTHPPTARRASVVPPLALPSTNSPGSPQTVQRNVSQMQSPTSTPNSSNQSPRQSVRAPNDAPSGSTLMLPSSRRAESHTSASSDALALAATSEAWTAVAASKP
jgi:hypothetical protein